MISLGFLGAIKRGIVTTATAVSADSKKTLPCLGLIEYCLGDGFFLKTIMGPTDYRGVASTV
jgi:hypothetical protein